jgi:mRNA interferase MazF
MPDHLRSPQFATATRDRSSDKGIPFHARTTDHGFAKCEDVRSISVERLLSRRGRVTPEELALIQDRPRLLLGL